MYVLEMRKTELCVIFLALVFLHGSYVEFTKIKIFLHIDFVGLLYGSGYYSTPFSQSICSRNDLYSDNVLFSCFFVCSSILHLLLHTAEWMLSLGGPTCSGGAHCSSGLLLSNTTCVSTLLLCSVSLPPPLPPAYISHFQAGQVV